ncbi:hypothetical protein DL546_008511 [Coniochaeta pulveracea]|uniref:Mid2 domain-containing protein n=1 Tax=Coniochaeta pulveracea TaxID=177199 RepID=A0A420YMS6_9PEZI|nr:hypothetical protein DL546_008511 [Coniochaeta pulveracea]
MPSTRNLPLRRVLAASLLFASAVLSLPTELHIIIEDREVASAAPSDWVTVGPSGARTIKPTAIGPDGATTTDQRAPESLTATGTYTLLPISTAPTTSTGLPPVATASADGTGTHLACEVYTGADAPFCAPKSGTQLNPGASYFVTWNPTYFSDTDTWLELQGEYLDGSGNGFTSERIPATQLYYAWTIDPNILSTHHTTDLALNMTLTLVQFETQTSNEAIDTADGPSVIITKNSQNYSPTSATKHHHTNVAAIVVPIIVVVVLILMIGLCVFSWRRTGTVPVLGALKRRSTAGGAGYGERQSRSQRLGAGADPVVGRPASRVKSAAGVELTDRDSWSPSTSPRGGNVFRQELQRQERER